MVSYGENKRGKIHYAGYDAPNESDNSEYWANTACGLEETEAGLTNEKKYVTCKRCLKRVEQLKE